MTPEEKSYLDWVRNTVTAFIDKTKGQEFNEEFKKNIVKDVDAAFDKVGEKYALTKDDIKIIYFIYVTERLETMKNLIKDEFPADVIDGMISKYKEGN